ncbi:MAG: Myo-inositol 2-dehydrogenase (EC [uncultured Caballeronia sp.]|nr:MAG: Myo-inositol 2-dehydrogenase (EC [uncultured Caballeronia sp.]
MMKPAIAIVGCGRMGLIRAQALKCVSHRVRYVFDVDNSRASQVAGIHNSRAVASLAEMNWSGLDAVFVCTPPNDRAAMEIAIRLDKHVFVEKPIHLSARHSLSLLSMTLPRDHIFAVGYMNRYRSSIEEVRKRIEGMPILGFQAHWICKPYMVPWWADPAQSGGPLNEQATHMVDLIRYLLGEVYQVTAIQGMSGPGTVSIMLRMQSGCIGTFVYSCSATKKDIGLRLFTQHTPIVLSGWDFYLSDAPWQTSPLQGQSSEDAFLSETKSFIDAVESGDAQAVRSPFADAFKTQVVVDCIRNSLRLGTHVTVEAYREKLNAL